MAETTLLIDTQPSSSPPPVLVSVYLRGGADGLHLVPPTKDSYYRRSRPTLAVSTAKALPVDDIFGMHPDLSEIHSLYTTGKLAVVHQFGTEEASRSHFEATDYLHYGGRLGGGWLGRFVHHTRDLALPGPLSAISIGETVSDELQGIAAVALRSLKDFQLPETKSKLPDALAKLYAHAPTGLKTSAENTLQAMERIRRLVAEEEQRDNKQKTTEPFAAGLTLIAKLIRMNLGLRAATIELGGWDSHFGQGQALSNNVSALSKGLAAFADAMGPDLAQAHLAVMTEFGRTAAENTSLGTDHGRASVAFLLGGGVQGGKIHHRWGGLDQGVVLDPSIQGKFDARGDLDVKIDFRQMLVPIMQRIAPKLEAGTIFPGFKSETLPLFG
jgi:uncharacterized protein (DUF1501 family)